MLPNLFNALSNQNYPPELIELVLVNDHSTDKTKEVMLKAAHSFPNVKIVDAVEKPFPAKKGALQIGVQESSNNFILFTDADCLPEENWIRAMVSQLTSGSDVVIGLVAYRWRDSFVSQIAAYERFKDYSAVFALSRLNFHYTAIGCSFGYTRKTFSLLNGYTNTLDTISGDDDLFLREAIKRKLKIATVYFGKSAVSTEPPKYLRQYFHQKLRHIKSSHYYIPSAQLYLGIFHLSGFFSQFSFILAGITPLFLLPFIIKIVSEFLFTKKYMRYFGHNFSSFFILRASMVMEILTPINFINSLLFKVKWKV